MAKRLDLYKINVIGIFYVFWLLGFISSLVEWLLHRNDKDPQGIAFAEANLLFLVYNSFFFLILGIQYLGIANPIRIVGAQHFRFLGDNVKPLVKFKIQGWIAILLELGISLLMIGMIDSVIALFIPAEPFAILPFEAYFFYLNAAIGETIVYQVVWFYFGKHLTRIAFKIDIRRGKDSAKKLIADIIIVTSSAIVFTLTHIPVFGSTPILLVGTFLAGLIWNIFYLLSKNPLVPMFSHVMINTIVAGGVAQTLRQTQSSTS